MALSDAGLADDGHETASAPCNLFEVLGQGAQLSGPANRQALGRGEPPAVLKRPGGFLFRGQSFGRVQRALIENAPIERLGFLVRGHAQLPFENGAAGAVLGQRRGAHALGQVELHQAAVQILSEGVDAQRAARGFNRGAYVRTRFLVGEKALEGLHRQIPIPAPGLRQPIFEIRRIDAQAGEEFTPVQRRRLDQRIWRTLGDQAVEFARVDPDGLGVQRNHLALQTQHWNLVLGELAGQGEKSLTQALARALLVGLAPEQRRQHLTRG